MKIMCANCTNEASFLLIDNVEDLEAFCVSCFESILFRLVKLAERQQQAPTRNEQAISFWRGAPKTNLDSLETFHVNKKLSDVR